jgi:hypothetical protein
MIGWEIVMRPGDVVGSKYSVVRKIGGNVFVARFLTVIVTCRQQEKHLLSHLIDVVSAQRLGRSAPPLLASSSTTT